MEESTQGILLTEEKYDSQRRALVDALHKQAESFDKTIITLSTGAIAFSVLVIDKVSPDPAFWTKFAVAGSRIAFAGSAVCVLVSFLFSQDCHNELIKEWDKTFKDQKVADNSRSRKLDNRTRRWNLRSAILFVAGIVLLGIFILGNLMRSNMVDKRTSRRIEEGA